MDDIILVNPGGRTVEVPGELGQDMLQQNGWRVASEDEKKALKDFFKENSPEVLALREKNRKAAAEKAAAEFVAAQEAPAVVKPAKPANEDVSKEDTPKSRGAK